MRGATREELLRSNAIRISIHAPRAGATYEALARGGSRYISIHAPRAGATVSRFCLIAGLQFQSTLPVRERPAFYQTLAQAFYFNPRSPCGSDSFACSISSAQSIFQSTLPVRERLRYSLSRESKRSISIHAPRAGATQRDPSAGQANKFQSTLPVRERRVQHSTGVIRHPNFNPRSPCGSDWLAYRCRSRAVYFNPRSPCGSDSLKKDNPKPGLHFNPRSPCGSDEPGLEKVQGSGIFQSTLPVRERLSSPGSDLYLIRISIHAPRAGATTIMPPVLYQAIISIHAPRAGATNPSRDCGRTCRFQSTLPVRERLRHLLPLHHRAGFQSTLPVRERPAVLEILNKSVSISIHAPRAGATALLATLERVYGYFNPRSPCGSDF